MQTLSQGGGNGHGYQWLPDRCGCSSLAGAQGCSHTAYWLSSFLGVATAGSQELEGLSLYLVLFILILWGNTKQSSLAPSPALCLTSSLWMGIQVPGPDQIRAWKRVAHFPVKVALCAMGLKVTLQLFWVQVMKGGIFWCSPLFWRMVPFKAWKGRRKQSIHSHPSLSHFHSP